MCGGQYFDKLVRKESVITTMKMDQNCLHFTATAKITSTELWKQRSRV